MKYKIYAGLNGSFGGASHRYTENCETPTEAEELAYEEALEMYEQYAGLQGLKTFNDCVSEASQYMPRNKYDSDEDYQKDIEEEATEIYNSIRVGWIDYWAEEIGE